jgi:dihydrofolate reductase
MRTISIFEQVSLDGYYASATDDPWYHAQRADPEFVEFISSNASGDGELLFGRKTYDQMAAFWPTAEAARAMPAVAKGMNAKRKLVASRSMTSAAWQHTQVIGGDLVAAVRELKAQAGDPIVILGSGTIVAQLTEADLIDEYQLLVIPVVLGAGRTLFEGTTRRIELALASSRSFRNGCIFGVYRR